MIKFFHLLIFAGFFWETSKAQKIEIFGGPNWNKFYDQKKNSHLVSSYTPGLGFSFGIGIDSFRKERFQYRLSLQMDNYTGKLISTANYSGSGSTVKARVNKTILSFGFFPVNLRFRNMLDINFGLEYSRLVHQSYIGIADTWDLQFSRSSNSYDLSKQHISYKNYYGLKSRIALDLIIWKSISISPQYLIYFGSNEFKRFSLGTRSVRHSICIGIKKSV